MPPLPLAILLLIFVTATLSKSFRPKQLHQLVMLISRKPTLQVRIEIRDRVKNIREKLNDVIRPTYLLYYLPILQRNITINAALCSARHFLRQIRHMLFIKLCLFNHLCASSTVDFDPFN